MSGKIAIRLDRQDSLLVKLFKGEIKSEVILGYSNIINKTKDKIEKVDMSKWYFVKKNVNEYEFPSKKFHISRGYFKMKEMLIDYSIDLNCNSLHLCDAPGGFIECIMEYKGQEYATHTMSLISKDPSIPKYHNSIIQNRNINVYTNNDGDINRLENLIFLKKKCKDVSLIISDGGITENGDFNNKEKIHVKLIFSEILIALNVLNDGGTFIVKFFDCFSKITIDFIYLLCHMFEKVDISKPYTSRPTNSERYIICTSYNRKRFNTYISNVLLHLYVKGIEGYNSIFTLPKSFIDTMREINIHISKNQMENINIIIDIIEGRVVLPLIKNTSKAEKWNRKYTSVIK